MQVTCHSCGRTGEAASVFDILRRSGPPMPQFVLEGKDIGLPAKLAWCTLCPPIPPVVTKVGMFGGATPFTAMPELMMVPILVTQYAMHLMKSGIFATEYGRGYFREIGEQFRSPGGGR